MLLNAVIIVLREFLEAALMISVLLALGDRMPTGRRWAGWSICIGLAGAVIYAGNIAMVSDWLNGVGQEVINALMQIMIYCCLTLTVVLFSNNRARTGRTDSRMVFLMMTSVSLAIMREGSEILIYLASFTNNPELFEPILLGGMVGAGIGVSVGVLAYYGLLNANRNCSPWASIGAAMLIAAGIAGQATLLLIQADWLPSRAPLWDSSGWISEHSVTGQLLYALIGYEATPSPIQAAVYLASLVLPVILMTLIKKSSNTDG